MVPPESDDPLHVFVQGLPDDVGLTARTLAHSWESGAGSVRVGKLAIRLLGGIGWTSGTVYGGANPRLELCRVIMEHHGVTAEAWTHWSDEYADLNHHGFDSKAKYPSVPLEKMTGGELARLVTGLRDLAQMVC